MDAITPMTVQKLTAARPTRLRARTGIRSIALLALANAAVLVGLLVPVELVFGTWIRPMRLSDLKRFSIPIDTSFEFDTSSLYSGGPRNPIRYSRDAWGLRGAHGAPNRVELLTVGGSTTEQRYLDDTATWQEVAARELRRAGRPLVIANAGVDGQSTLGHMFNFDYWFPLLPDLHPRIVLFYIGTNDVLRHEQRIKYDQSVDATSWRIRSATWQLLTTIRRNVRARDVGVVHGRVRPVRDDEFTTDGLLSPAERAAIAADLAASVLRNVDGLRRRAEALGSTPIFMTQTALGWNADLENPPRGVKGTIRVHGVTVNYADVSYLHQELNRGLMRYCGETGTVCFDLASDVAFGVDDYYDYLHNTPEGAEKIGRYLAARLEAAEPLVAR